MSMNKLLLITLLFTFGDSAYAVGDVAAGQIVFNQCASCHQVGASARAGFGPQLNGIFGRPSGSTKDYNYSAAMKNANIVWSEKILTAYIKSPSDIVPGTKMRLWGFSDDEKIADLLAYLHTFQAAPARLP